MLLAALVLINSVKMKVLAVNLYVGPVLRYASPGISTLCSGLLVASDTAM